MNESPSALDLLSSRVDELEKRVHLLEHPGEARAALPTQQPAQPIALADQNIESLETGNIFPIIGRALLGIAGAYVLRAVAETGAIPKLAVSAIAVLYAFAWLVWSARVSSSLARVVYAGTSALIIAPLLWEDTLAFHVFSPMASAGILAGFLTLATVLGLRTETARTMWIAQSIAVLAAAALAFSSRQILPFLWALLLTVLVSEVAAIRAFAQPLLPVYALVSDAVLAALIFIYSGPQNARAAYPELSIAHLIAPAVALFALSGTAVVVRVVAHKRAINAFDLLQVTIAFLIAAAAIIYFTPQKGPTFLGTASLILSAAAYLVTFRLLRDRSELRTFRWFGAWSAALLLAGTLWALPSTIAAIILALAAILAIYLSGHMKAGTLELHAVLFLVAAAVISALPQYVFATLAATLPHATTLSILVVSACAAVATTLAGPSAGSAWQRIPRLFPPLLAVSGCIALLVHGVAAATAAFVHLDLHHVAFLRTFTICIAALAIAFGGARWGRTQLTHLAYAVLAFVAAKLFFEDLRLGRMEYIAGSFALFAITLIAVPRLIRIGSRRRTAAGAVSPSAAD